VVEVMASLTLVFATFGQRVNGGDGDGGGSGDSDGGGGGEGVHSGGLDLMDRVERLAFNALPAALTVWTGEQCSPRHQPRFEPSDLQLNDIL